MLLPPSFPVFCDSERLAHTISMPHTHSFVSPPFNLSISLISSSPSFGRRLGQHLLKSPSSRLRVPSVLPFIDLRGRPISIIATHNTHPDPHFVLFPCATLSSWPAALRSKSHSFLWRRLSFNALGRSMPRRTAAQVPVIGLQRLPRAFSHRSSRPTHLDHYRTQHPLRSTSRTPPFLSVAPNGLPVA